MALSVSLKVSSRLTERLETLGPDLRTALENELAPVATGVTRAARALARAHIRFLGVKPGAYLESIQGGVSTKEKAVLGYVRSGSPLAHLLEGGAHTPPHKITPLNAVALSWNSAAGQVFAKIVNDPGATIPAYPALSPAFDDARRDIEAAINRAVARVKDAK